MKRSLITTFQPTPYRPRGLSACVVALVICLAGSLLASCGLQSGGDTIAFLQGKTLWAINPDGSSPRKLSQGNIVSMSWSPDHHQYVLRVASPFAPPDPLSMLGAPDAPGDLEVGSISGGFPIQITPTLGGLSRSDAWWNANGNRLLYRESFTGAGPAAATYIVSQADQPVGIARKPVANSFGIPVLSPDGTQIATEDNAGNVRLGAPGTAGSVIATGAILTLPGTNRPARLLWQPHHDALLYVATGAKSTAALQLVTLDGQKRALGEISGLLDLAFSPDGTRLLLRTSNGFTIWNVAQPGQPVFSWAEDDPAALPWWSPAGGRILVQDYHGSRLVDIAGRSVTTLVIFPGAAPTNITNVTTWHPAAGSPWNAAGDRFVFVGGAQMQWRDMPLPAPQRSAGGLYVANPSSSDTPTRIDEGADRSPQWSYLDPSAAFLVMA